MGMGGDGTAGSTSWVIICAKCGRRRASMGNSSVLEAGLLEVSLTRRIAAAPEFVFRAWTDPKHLAEWGGAKGFTKRGYEGGARVGVAVPNYMPAPNGLVAAMTRGI